MHDQKKLLEKAKSGNIRAFHTLYSEFQPQLKSYLYRLVANRNDMEDLAHDVFIIAFENIGSFRKESSLKTWVFSIATNHARKHLKKNKSWYLNTFERTRDLAHQDKDIMKLLDQAHQLSPHGSYEIREHIDYCFTCVSKMLPLKQQVALILKEIYAFKVKEITLIMDTTYGKVKHLLHNSRKKMIKIFNNTCALVSKKGVCHQCSGLNGKFNPKQDSQEQLMKIEMVKAQNNLDTKKLYSLRVELVKSIDPLYSNGADLHEAFMSINHKVNA
jgi:RNA polymerase sigma-70 factor (ECF subfamily)